MTTRRGTTCSRVTTLAILNRRRLAAEARVRHAVATIASRLRGKDERMNRINMVLSIALASCGGLADPLVEPTDAGSAAEARREPSCVQVVASLFSCARPRRRGLRLSARCSAGRLQRGGAELLVLSAYDWTGRGGRCVSRRSDRVHARARRGWSGVCGAR